MQLARRGERDTRVVPAGEPFDLLRREDLPVIAQRVLQRIDDVVADDLRRAFVVEYGAKRFECGHLLLREMVDPFISRKKLRRQATKIVAAAAENAWRV